MNFTTRKFSTPSALLLWLLIIYVVLFLGKAIVNKGTVYGDGRYYFSWLHSVVVDHDSNFTNEYSHFQIQEPTTPLRVPGNVYAIGPALFWSPMYILARLLLPGDGYTFWSQLLVGLGNVFYSWVGIVILYRLLHKYFDEVISITSTMAVALGSNLLFYGALDTVNSHSVSFLLSVLVVTLVVEKRHCFVIAFTIGLLALMRSQDAVFLLLLLPALMYSFRNGNVVQAIRNFLILCSGFLLGFLPQFIAWQILYGNAFRSPYLDSYHYFDLLHPKLWEVLFSVNNGLFLWTPLIAGGVIGLVVTQRIPLSLKWSAIMVCIVEWVLIASWSFWWQGASFSGRMFISLMPLFSLGLATIVAKIKHQYLLKILITIVVWNMGATMVYLLGH